MRGTIVVVEDTSAMAISVELHLARSRLGASCRIQVVASGLLLARQLDQQPNRSVRLLILDYNCGGDQTSAQHIPRLRQHQALRPDALIIGWSASAAAAAQFQSYGADGFVAKNWGAERSVQLFEEIIERRRHGEPWIAFDLH